ncbi:MAG: glycosyltransferase family 39 protein [Patescibacteria group bacterium]|nr:glycosyltransferase family 39 protein [Patescibacteria group bacterium]
MKKGKPNIILLLITFLSFALRFWKLASFPVSLNIDEVVIGYDSYSILKTAKDQWGSFLPLAFQSIGDYKAPVLIYLMVPAIKIFGLNEFGIRFTVAFFGSLTPLLIFFLADYFFKRKEIALIASFLLAISPWHIHYSRATFEAILALFFFLSGVTIFCRSIPLKGKFWWLSGIFFCLSLYTYHAERIFIPLFLVVLLLVYFKEIRKNFKNVLVALIISFIILLPLASIMLSPQGQTRAKSVFFTNDYELRVVKFGEIEKRGGISFFEKILNGKPVATVSFLLKRYLEYSDISYLFFKGMNYTPDKFPAIGLMYLFELPFFLLGIFKLTQKSLTKDKIFLAFGWLLLGPIPSALSNNSQHSLRSLTLIPIPQFLSALGLFTFFNWFLNLNIAENLKKIFYFLCSLLLLSSFIYYFDLYYVQFPYHYSHYLMYGLKEVALYAWEHHNEYEQVIIDPDFGLEGKNITGIPFAYLLVYGREDPRVVQAGKSPYEFENFSYRPVYWPEDQKLKNSLLVASFWQLSPEEVPAEQIVKVVKLYNGKPMFYLVKTK